MNTENTCKSNEYVSCDKQRCTECGWNKDVEKKRIALIRGQDQEQMHNEPSEKERRRGRFIGTWYDGYADGNPVYDEWECSECGCVFEDEEPTYNYCPNCGADMRGI